jgi:hypothetical protein
MSFAEFYRAGGGWMHLILLTGIVSAGLAIALPIAAFMSGRPRTAALLAGILAGAGAAAVLLGLAGQAVGLARTESALAVVTPELRDQLRAMGSAESRTCLVFGLCVAVVPWMGALVTVGRAVTARATPLAVCGGLALALAVGAVVAAGAASQMALVERDHLLARVEQGDRSAFLSAGTAAARARLMRGLVAGSALALIGGVLLAAGIGTARDAPSA